MANLKRNSTCFLMLLISILFCSANVVHSFLQKTGKATNFMHRRSTPSASFPRTVKSKPLRSSSLPVPAENASVEKRNKAVVIAGASGYIGRAVVQESVKRGYHTVALVRNATRFSGQVLNDADGLEFYGNSMDGATVLECNVGDLDDLKALLSSLEIPIDTILSCLASPSGKKKDVYAIDYEATRNCLEAGQHVGARHFVLLSAFCCRNPLLQLQQAKIKMEDELASQSKMTWSVVRPTAYFKSISAQLDAIRGGAPYVLFGDGAVTRCNPIAESELAEFMLDCAVDESKFQRVLNVGGPDHPLTNRMLGELMFQAIGREPEYVHAPVWIFDVVIQGLQFVANLLPSTEFDDVVETARIGKYYAVEDMLTTETTEKYGIISTKDHFIKIATHGQDPFAPVRATAGIAQTLKFLQTAVYVIPLALYALSYSQQKVGSGAFNVPLMLTSLIGHH